MHTLELTRAGAVWRLGLNRPAVRNAIDAQMLEELREVVASLAAESPRVLVLEGAGACFSAGADLAWMRRSAELSVAENIAEARALAELFGALDAAPCIVVASVHGAAMGGAVGLVACADIVVAADDARFAFREVRLGLVPAVISPFVVRRIGVAAARRYFVTAESFDAHEAKRLGLVHEVVPLAELRARVDVIAGEVQKGAPKAALAAKALLRDLDSEIDAARVDSTSELIASLRCADEGQEGMRAFLEKRAPRWQ